MNTKHSWSDFRMRIPARDGKIVYKSTLTGAVVRMSPAKEGEINGWLKSESPMPADIQTLADPDIALIIPQGFDEYYAWRNRLMDKRNNEAHIFILHFLPTIQCQLTCSYCFENGGNRGVGMRPEIIIQSREWLDEYLTAHPEIDTFRTVLFGGEPLLRKDIAEAGLRAFHSLAEEHGIEFWCELTSNGELLDEPTAQMLSSHEWRRVQITIDGPEEVHNARRSGHNKRPTFANILKNIRMLLETDYIPKVDIRISFDLLNADRIPELIRCLAAFEKRDRINLSLGLITPTLEHPEKNEDECLLAKKAIATWTIAQECGFQIPEEFITGPWCVAIAKHSAILQPDGSLQKCFCTAGREEYNFATVHDTSASYSRDARFEHFKRTDQCIEEKCEFLPMCGGGCIHDAVVAHNGPDGFEKRFCQKTLLSEYNHGLLKLNHE